MKQLQRFSTGRDYGAPQVIEWYQTNEEVVFRDSVRGIHGKFQTGGFLQNNRLVLQTYDLGIYTDMCLFEFQNFLNEHL